MTSEKDKVCYHCASREIPSTDELQQPCRCYVSQNIYTHSSCFQSQRQAALKHQHYNVSLQDLLHCGQCDASFAFGINTLLQTVLLDDNAINVSTLICIVFIALVFIYLVVQCQLSFITICMVLTVYCALLFHIILWAVGRYTQNDHVPLSLDALFSFSANNILDLITAVRASMTILQKYLLVSLPINSRDSVKQICPR